MTLPAAINWTFCAHTDIGLVRKGNEDNFLILDLSTERHWMAHETEQTGVQTLAQGREGVVFAVSDGMGGALAGEVASRMAVEAFAARLLALRGGRDTDGAAHGAAFAERLRASVEEANEAIYGESLSNVECRGMGATFTAVALDGDTAYFAQIGDSRAHVIRDGHIRRITKDQSLVQQLIDSGQITEEEAETHGYRNYILQALGPMPGVTVEMNRLRLVVGDVLLLCSDGLSGKLREPEMLEIVASAPDLGAACAGLIGEANERGGEDNITVVLAQYLGEKAATPEGEIPEPELVARAPDADDLDQELPAAAYSPPAPIPPAPISAQPDEAAELNPVGLASSAAPDVPREGAASPDAAPTKLPVRSAQPHPSPGQMPTTGPMVGGDLKPGEKRVGGRRFTLAFIGALLLLGVGAVYLYVQLADSRVALQQRRLSDLQSRVETLRQRVPEAQAADYNVRLDQLARQLDAASALLNEGSSLLPTKVGKVSAACAEVEPEVQRLEQRLGVTPVK
jgi:PPM family protein phosphatase